MTITYIDREGRRVDPWGDIVEEKPADAVLTLTEALESQTVAELRGIAADCGIEGYSDMKKAELVEAIAVFTAEHGDE